MTIRTTWMGCLLVALVGCALPESQPLDGIQVDVGDAQGGVWERTFVEGLDGDSLVGADGTRFRLIGINAPDPPECLADEARDRVATLVDGVEVTLRQAEEEQFDQFDRELVYVFIDERVDFGNETRIEEVFLNELLVEEGLAIAIHSEPNMGRADLLFAAQERARRTGAGIWSDTACGSGPLVRIIVTDIVANPPGPDGEALESETVTIANAGDEPAELTDWTVRDESTRNRYTFPAGFVLEPGATVTIDAGSGEFGFGEGSPVWNNGGDTVFVVDDQGRFVTYSTIEG